MTKHRDIFAALAAPFAREEVKTRPQGGRQLSYVTARTVMNRLDEVLGPENWWDEYFPSEHSVLCKLTIRLPDGQVLTKMDAGGFAGMSDPGDDDKSGFSDAFKRAAVKFGCSRYLYRDGVPHFDGEVPASHPSPDREIPPDRFGDRAPAPRNNGKGHGDPRTGKALFAWLKDQEQEHGVALIKPLNERGKKAGLPFKMTEWPDEIIPKVYSEARKIIAEAKGARETIPPRRNEPMTQADADELAATADDDPVEAE